MATDTYRDPITWNECGCFVSRHQGECSQWNDDGERFAVILNGETAATFTDVEAACDFYNDHACLYCRTWKSMHNGRCCDVQTWTRS
jgi:hypothetical protein